MRKRLWNELVQVHYNMIYVVEYQRFQRTALKTINITIIILSAGALISALTNAGLTILATALLTFASLLKEILPNLIFDEKRLSELDKIHSFYCQLLDQYERLWYESENDTVQEQELLTNFYVLKEQEYCHNPIINELLAVKLWFVARKADTETRNYCERNF